MKTLYILIVGMVLTLDLFGQISVKNGGLDKNNILIYANDNGRLELEVNDKIKINSSNISYLNNIYLQKNNYKKSDEALMLKFFNQPINTDIVKKMITDLSDGTEIDEDQLEQELSLKLKKLDNYISHKIKDIVEATEDQKAYYEYELKTKAEFPKYNILSYDQLLAVFVNKETLIPLDLSQKFFLTLNGNYYLCKIDENNKKIKSKITNKSIEVDVYVVSIIKSLDNMKEGTIFSIEKHNKLPYSISVLKNKDELEKYDLSLIKNKNLSKYLDMLKNYPTDLVGFDFDKSEIRASYKVKTKNGVKYLKTSFKKVGKRKNVISVSLDGSYMIFDTSKGSNSEVSHKGYLLDAKTYLFQVKKDMKVDGVQKVQWKQSPKKSMISVKYKDSDNKIATQKFSKGKKQYYDFSALWYLISWNNLNNIGEKPFLLINEDFPFEAKYIKKDYGYLVTFRNSDKYKFYLDQYSRVKKVIDIKNGIEMLISSDGFVTDEIESNRAKVSNAFKKYNLIEVNYND
ncbi:MAG: hypothetical protein U9O56_07010 [Campylobacterota bacterium]|nr:hypothetical protein [Campylobacterota bacterium]